MLGGLVAFLPTGCDRAADGGSSEQGNAVSVVVLDPAGLPETGVRVRIRPADWIRGRFLSALDSADGFTDGQGRFTSKRLAQGVYRVDASLEGFAASTVGGTSEGPIERTLEMARGATLLLDGLDAADQVSLTGFDRVPSLLPDGRVRFDDLPASALVLHVAGAAGTRRIELDAPAPGTTREYVFSPVGIDSASSWTLDSLGFPSILFGAGSIDFFLAGGDVHVQRLSGTTWIPVATPYRVDSTQSGWFRYAGGSWIGAPRNLRWAVWPSDPGLAMAWESGGIDSPSVPMITYRDAVPVLDTAPRWVSMTSSQWVDFGIVTDTGFREGSLEFLARPGAGFSPASAYTLLGEGGGRLLVGYLRGALFFLKSDDSVQRWVTTPPGQLAERRWYRVLATWGPQGMTLSVNDSLRAWSDDTTGYAPGSADDSLRHLVAGAKSGCCMGGIGIGGALHSEGDIASIRLRRRQPVLWKDRRPHACPDSVAGDLLQRCGALPISRIDVASRPTLYPVHAENDN